MIPPLGAVFLRYEPETTEPPQKKKTKKQEKKPGKPVDAPKAKAKAKGHRT